MSASAAHLTETEQVDPLGGIDGFISWVLDKIQLLSALALTTLMYGGVLYYTWTPLASAVKDAQITGFWNCALAVLGAYGVVLLLRDVASNTLYNPWRLFKGGGARGRQFSKRIELFATAPRPAAVLLLAWIVADILS